MAPMYYRGAHAALCVFDVTSEESFGALQDWIMELQEQAREDVGAWPRGGVPPGEARAANLSPPAAARPRPRPCPRNAELFVVANKIDLAQRRSVQSVRAYEYAKSVNAGVRPVVVVWGGGDHSSRPRHRLHFPTPPLQYVETSAKTGSGVADLFTSVAQALVKRHGAGYRPSGGAAKGIVQLPESASPPSKKRGCC